MRFILTFLISLMVSVSGWAEYRLAVFGDSLSAGYHLAQKDSFYAQLEKALRDKGYDISVLNVSKSGETTFGGISRMPKLFSQKPDGVILELGINDTFKNKPIKSIRENLRQLINMCQDRQISVLLAGMKAFPKKKADYREQFENMYRELATEYNLDFYPFFMTGLFNTEYFDPRVKNDYLLPNDIHPNPKGVSVMVKGILPTVEQFLNKQDIWPK